MQFRLCVCVSGCCTCLPLLATFATAEWSKPSKGVCASIQILQITHRLFHVQPLKQTPTLSCSDTPHLQTAECLVASSRRHCCSHGHQGGWRGWGPTCQTWHIPEEGWNAHDLVAAAAARSLRLLWHDNKQSTLCHMSAFAVDTQ